MKNPPVDICLHASHLCSSNCPPSDEHAHAGKWEVFAGHCGKSGFANGAASKALFNHPKGMCLTSEGQLIVVDSINSCIRSIDLNSSRRSPPHISGKDAVMLMNLKLLMPMVLKSHFLCCIANAGLMPYTKFHSSAQGTLFAML